MTQATPPQIPCLPRRSSGFATASFVLGIVSLAAFYCCCGSGLIPGVLAIVFGHVGLREIRRSQGQLDGYGLAVAGLVTGYVSVAIQILMIIFSGLIVLFSLLVSAAEEGHRHVRW